MASFKLGDHKSKRGERNIYLNFYYDGNKHPFKWNTNIAINEKYWSKKKQRAILTALHQESIQINEELNAVDETINRIYNKLRGTLITNEILRQKITNGNFVDAASQDFFKFARNNNLRLKTDTMRTWNATVSIIEGFQKKYGSIGFESFSVEFYNKFKDYCFKDLGYKDSTFSTRIGNLKAILRNAEEMGIVVNQGYKSRSFKKIKYVSNAVYLSEEEILRLRDFDFKGIASYREIADDFIVRCYIGTRFSDSDIKKSNIITEKGIDFLKIFTKKTLTQVHIPVHKTARKILDKYDWSIKKFSNAHTNEALKDIFRIAGFTSVISLAETVNGEVRIIEKQKWELISTHTARRTLATNMFLFGVSPSLICVITGHTTEKQLMDYVKADNLSKALLLSKSGFYK